VFAGVIYGASRKPTDVGPSGSVSVRCLAGLLLDINTPNLDYRKWELSI
jgi:hypothetical protein